MGSRVFFSALQFNPCGCAILGEQAEFKAEMEAAYSVENAVRAALTVWLGDGAPGNWALASAIAPNAVQILDFMHSVENGVKCGKALLGEGDHGLPDWKEAIETTAPTPTESAMPTSWPEACSWAAAPSRAPTATSFKRA